MLLHSIRCQSTKSRLPPKSLIIKQANRLNKKNPDSSKLVVSSLRDVLSLFQANSQTQEDDDLDALNHDHYILQQIESGELETLLKSKFHFDHSTDLLSTKALIQNFPNLKKDELDVLIKANDLQNVKTWSSIPKYLKQVQFYLAFGSHGPRKDLPFTTSQKPLDFTFLERVKDTNGNVYRKLNKDQLVNLYGITPYRKDFFSDKKLDPMSRFFVWVAIAVSIIVASKEYVMHSNGEKLVTVVNSNDDDS